MALFYVRIVYLLCVLWYLLIMKTIIKNVHIINPIGKISQKGSILIEDGVIAKIALSDSDCEKPESLCDCSGELTIIEADNLVASPGLVDIHVHFRDPGQTHKEDIETGAKAAAAGGFTSVIMMANTVPSVDNSETLEYVIDKAGQQGIHVYATAAVTKGLKGSELTDFAELWKIGAVGFTDDGIPLMDEGLLKEAMYRAKELDAPISLHEEDPKLIGNSGVNAGEIATKMGLEGASREAEYTLIGRDINIGIETGAKLNIQHISTAEGVNLVREARKEHKNIHAEATPHHFTLTQEAVLEHGTYAKMNPPVRCESDRMAVIQGLKDGTIEFIATDHAPHSVDEKDREFTKAPSGIIGLETSLALGITELVHKGYLTMDELIEKMSVNPSMLYKIPAGDISEGKIADMVLFDPNEEWTVQSYFSKSVNTPFTGRKLKGKVKYTISSGEIVYRDK